MSFFKGMVFFLPASKALSYSWNFGLMLGIVFVFQFFSGVFLVFCYVADGSLAFDSVQYIMFESNFGWIFRLLHFNGASLFFFFVYLHFFKALFFLSYRLSFVWLSGLSIFILLMAEAFMGYVLVWAQMSFWAAVVITSLFSVIPIWGPSIVLWLWGGYGVSNVVLKFFFCFHFILPFFLLVIVFFHLIFLHDTGSTSVLFCHGDYDKVVFFSFYWWKDSLNFLVILFFFVAFFFFPFVLGDPEMFIEADFMKSPVHIVPEWYFLFAYAILRAVANKILGVFLLLLSVFCFFFFLLYKSYVSVFSFLNKFFVSFFILSGLMLGWLGQCLIEFPFLELSVIFSFFYFFFVFSLVFFNFFFSFLF